MREILYRAISMCRGEHWVYGQPRHYVRNPHTEKWTIYDPATGIETDIVEETLGQYTGLNDKNGNKIFEGDIIQTEFSKSIVKFGEYQHTNAQSGYRNGDLGFYAYHIDITHRDCVRNDLLFFNEQCEIIGNIHDNHELTKGGMK